MTKLEFGARLIYVGGNITAYSL